MAGEFSALVTCAVQKSLINDAGVAFTGHTEYIASAPTAAAGDDLLTAGELRVALATTHLPLRASVTRSVSTGWCRSCISCRTG